MEEQKHNYLEADPSQRVELKKLGLNDSDFQNVTLGKDKNELQMKAAFMEDVAAFNTTLETLSIKEEEKLENINESNKLMIN